MVVRTAKLSPVPFIVVQGLRTVDEQRQCCARGASQTMNSRHLTGHAVDLVPNPDGQIDWSWPSARILAKAMRDAAKLERVTLEWGGDWKRFPDGGHFQLPWKKYPIEASWPHEPVTVHPDYKPVAIPRPEVYLPPEVTKAPRHTETPRTNLLKSKTVMGAGASMWGGIVQTWGQAKEAIYGHPAAITWIAVGIGAVIVIGAMVAIHSRWKDGGRPTWRQSLGGF